MTAAWRPGSQPRQADGSELHQRIRSAVIARLGSQVDASLLDVIIQRVLPEHGIEVTPCSSAELRARRSARSNIPARKD